MPQEDINIQNLLSQVSFKKELATVILSQYINYKVL
jgi:hypothetical protein